MHQQSHVGLEWRKNDVEDVPKITLEAKSGIALGNEIAPGRASVYDLGTTTTAQEAVDEARALADMRMQRSPIELVAQNRVGRNFLP
jgi:hypothetical protein